MITFESDTRGCGESLCQGLSTSRAAPAMCRETSASYKASSSTRDSRAVLMKNDPCFMAANFCASKKLLVSGVTRAWRDTKSERANRSSRLVIPIPWPLPEQLTRTDLTPGLTCQKPVPAWLPGRLHCHTPPDPEYALPVRVRRSGRLQRQNRQRGPHGIHTRRRS